MLLFFVSNCWKNPDTIQIYNVTYITLLVAIVNLEIIFTYILIYKHIPKQHESIICEFG